MVDLAQRRVAEIAGLKEALSILANDHEESVEYCEAMSELS